MSESLFDQAVAKIRAFSVGGGPTQAIPSHRQPTHDLSMAQVGDGEWSWVPQPKQSIALASDADEIYYGGARGGGKTHCQTFWVVKPAIEKFNGRYRYTNYRAAVMRLQYNDLEDWIEVAKDLYAKLGGASVDKPVKFKFPSGSLITTGHMQERSSNAIRQGHNVHALAIDEVNQIGEERIYRKLLGSVRGSPTGLSQAFLTGNPGGPGDTWVKNRFVDVMVGGVQIPWGTKFVDPDSGMSRVFIQAHLRDNRKLLQKDPRYLLKLLQQDEVTRRQWLDGDWNVNPGTFFTEFRRTRSAYEPNHAYHCVHSSRVTIKAWYRKWMSIDWGYDDYCAVYWYMQDDEGRVYVFQEYLARRLGSFQLGVEIARLTLPYLPDNDDTVMECFVSPDLFHKTDERALRANEIVRGINHVLGFGTTVAFGYDKDEKELAERDPGLAYERYAIRTIQQLASARIALKIANNRRIEGLMYMREMLRWKAIDSMPDLERQYEVVSKSRDSRAKHLLRNYEVMLKTDTVLPKLRIFSDKCPKLVKALQNCQTDPDKPNEMLQYKGDDPIDSLRYGLMGYRDMPAEMPRSYYIAAMMDQAVERQKQSGVSDRFGLRLRHIMLQQEYDREKARAEAEELERMEAQAVLINADTDAGTEHGDDSFGGFL
jgi:hypothetical protein